MSDEHFAAEGRGDQGGEPAGEDLSLIHISGIETTAALLGAGKLRFFAGCRDCIREFGVYRWNEKSGRDEVLKENDHAMDDTRYFCYTILRRELRWVDWRRE